MRFLRLIAVSTVIVFGVPGIFGKSPQDVKHAISDWINILQAPEFDVAPDSFWSMPQKDAVQGYTELGFKLTCYGNLRKEDKIGSNTDYLCYTFTGSAFENIPARMVTFFFSKRKLAHVRIEFPNTSVFMLQSFLGRELAEYPRLDLKHGKVFGTDLSGKPLMVWDLGDGVIMTSSGTDPGGKLIVLWSSMDGLDQERVRAL